MGDSRDRREIELRKEDNTIHLKREIVIEVPKKELVSKLRSTLFDTESCKSFEILCDKLEQLITLRFSPDREKILSLYDDLFNPHVDVEKLNLTESQVKDYKDMFLKLLTRLMERSNFKPLSEHELEVATSSQYLFHLSTKINRKKLDDKFFSKTAEGDKDLGSRYAIYRRGIGIDKKSGQFYRAKVDFIVQFCWTRTKVYAVKAWNWLLGKPVAAEEPTHPQPDPTKSLESKSICVRRIHVSNSFQFKKFFKKLDLQEPTFAHMIIVYRKATSVSHTSCHGDQGIHIKHFQGIPMADMELILPAKKHPKLPYWDWATLFVFFFIALAGILSSLRQHNPMGLMIGIIVAFFSYATKVYLTFNMNVLEYERLINKLTEDKQLDCGHGTLLHVIDEAIQQEVKEAIIAYYVLLRYGDIDKETLQQQSNKILMELFQNGTSEFEADDALDKLKDFGIVEQEENTLRHIPMNRAIKIVREKIIQEL